MMIEERQRLKRIRKIARERQKEKEKEEIKIVRGRDAERDRQ